MPSKRRSLTPFGFRAKLFNRRRDAEQFVQEIKFKGYDAFWEIWGTKWKAYYATFK